MENLVPAALVESPQMIEVGVEDTFELEIQKIQSSYFLGVEA
ncbi:hypothetical protein L195_g062578, partial [Trifolium pratense]